MARLWNGHNRAGFSAYAQVLAFIGFVLIVGGIILSELVSMDPGALEAAANNTTDPYPQPTPLLPLWTLPIVGVFSVLCGVGIGYYKRYTEDKTE